ncbi:MAG: ABC transporter permease subunit [Bacteroidota bacterium]|nr:ABC transporter permease subunit [Bacteroidota bacterium]
MSLIRSYIKLSRKVSWADILILISILAILYGVIHFGQNFKAEFKPLAEIDLSPSALPEYTFFSLVRGFAAYGISLIFTLVYGYIAAYNRRAEKIMIPLLDILQSIPVLGFLPGLVIALIAVFPHSNIGLELAAILMIFTGQVWNMTFSFYRSLQSIPNELREAAKVYRLNWWLRFTKLELPYSTMGLVWNSMMSMAGGWFFLTISEAFIIGDKDFRLPGIGSYMSAAIQNGNVPAMIYAVIAMSLMIITVDQLLWKPLVVWAQKFKFEETESAVTPKSKVLDILRSSHIISLVREKNISPIIQFLKPLASIKQKKVNSLQNRVSAFQRFLKATVVWTFKIIIFLAGLFGSYKLFGLLVSVNVGEWKTIGIDLFLTFFRVLAAVVIGSLWTIPAGVAIGMNRRLSKIFQPVIQVVASFPAPMLFPIVLLLLMKLGGSIEYGSILLMMLGTQWYILFNVIAGAMAIPSDLREAASINRLSKKLKWKRLILPGIFPALVTGWVTATGGAWNASIVAEYVHFGSDILTATGLGAKITLATDSGNFGVLAASVIAMSTTVVLINRFFWKKLYILAEEKYGLTM